MADNTERLVIEADTSSLGRAADDLDKFTESADGAGGAAEEVGSKTKTLRDVFGSVAEPIDETGKSLKGLKQNYKDLTISQGQYTASMRMLPAQLTDVVTQLAGGQNPFLIMIQQGGQVKDSFGGLANTFKILKAAITPATLAFTAAAGAIGVMGAAAYQSSKQFDEVVSSIIFMGGAGYKSMQELNNAAQQVANSTGESLSSTTDLLVDLNNAGGLTATQMTTAAAAIQKFGQAGGDAKTAMADFAKIAKDPIKGMASLNEQFGFVDEAMAKHIIQLKKTKGEEAATTAVIDLFAKTMTDRSNKVIDATDNIGQAWLTIKSTASNVFGEIGVTIRAWGNQLIDIFKLVGLAIENLFTNITIIDGKIAGAIRDFISGIPGGDSFMEKTGMKGWADGVEKEGKKAVENAKKQVAEFGKVTDRLNRPQAEYEAEARAASGVKADGTDEKSRKAVSELAKESERKAKADKQSVALGDQMLEQYQAQSLALQAQISVLKNRKAFDQNQSQQMKDYQLLQAKINILEKISTDENGRKLTKQEQSLLANKNAVLTAAKETAELGNQVQQLQKQAELADQLQKSHDKIAASVQAAADNWGKSTQEQERALELAQRAAALRAQGATQDQIDADAADMTEQWKSQDAAITDWRRGLKDGLTDFAKDAQNFAGVAQQAVEAAFSGMANAMTDFITTGKADFKSFTVDILKMIVQIINKWLILKAIQGIGSAVGGSFGEFTSSLSVGSAMSSAPAVASGAGVMALSAFAAQPTARVAAAASDNVVPEPQIMSANGVASQAGTSGGGGSSIGQVNVTVMDGKATASSSDSGAVGRAYAAVIADSVNQGIEQALKPGGLIFMANNGRN